MSRTWLEIPFPSHLSRRDANGDTFADGVPVSPGAPELIQMAYTAIVNALEVIAEYRAIFAVFIYSAISIMVAD